MALVSYGYSDSEAGSEEEEEENNSNVLIPQPPQASSADDKTLNGQLNYTDTKNIVTENTQPSSSMFSYLPRSQNTSSRMKEGEIEDFIPKASKSDKPKPKVKITIPSLSDFKDDDDDEPVEKKIKPSSKGSGLLALLPPVKVTPLSNKSFVPQSLTLKNKPSKVKGENSKSLIPDSIKRKQMNAAVVSATKAKTIKAAKDGLESDDDDDIELPETFDDEMWQKVCGRQKQKQIIQQEEPVEPTGQTIDIAPEPEQPYAGLDNAAFKELVGRKRKEGNINIIDIHEDEILPEKDLWMTKSLTDPECAPKTVIDNPVDPTRKRKHHITYLAEQAKANEQELQNQWAANKFTRNLSRAKYGF